MYTRGEYITKDDCYGVLLSHSKDSGFEIALVSSGQIASAFKHDISGDYSFLNPKAKELYNILKNALVGCKPKNGTTLPFVLGTSVMYEITRAKMENLIELYNGEIVKADISGEDGTQVKLEYATENQIPQNIPYIKLTSAKQPKSNSLDSQFSDDEVVVRSVEEIALEKEDVSWLKNKKYYIVNDDAQAEQIFAYLDNYNGPIAYDTETTGLKINCFGKINSEYKARLEKYNAEHPDEQLRADRLVGIIFCVEDHISYYFPCFNRKFKNLYEDDNEIRRKIINNIKARYTVGEYALKQSDMARYIRETPAEQWGSDVILMERVRNILQTKHIVAHNGSFEWKVGWQYEVDTNLCDDTMIMHQIMYKFRTTTSNRGEPSNLKYLAKVELGIDQWELSDFFPDFKEDNSGQVRVGGKGRGKKAGSKIDFSYMTYEGTRVYAPTDGDVTLLLFKKYKSDMIKNHKEQEYIYSVEVIVACCIGYMEFYGHRIDEEKIFAVRDQTKAEIACIESEIRQEVGFCKPAELDAYNKLKNAMRVYAEADKSGDAQARADANQSTIDATNNLYKTIADDHEHELNLASPSQVAELFYDVLGYPVQGDKKSVAKKQIKPLVKALDEDGNLMYPVAKMYSDYKVKDTLMTKFFDNLTYYMYPGGLIFSSFGQISTATGRMSCSKPNAQQYPKAITSIVVPREGYIMMDADYSQIEYRVLTALAGNEWLAELFADPDSDYHTLMASLMYSVPYASVTPKMRSDAKSFNFGIPYGMGLKSLAILLKGNSKASSVDEAKEKYELYFKNQPKTRKFFDQVKEMAQVNKFTRTFWNRYRYYSFTDAEGNENNARKAAALRQAGNAVIQGCVRGDTLIQTKEHGIVQIQDVVDQHLDVWNGTKWTGGDILYSGQKRKCIVTFSTGQKFVCSPTHKFLVRSAKGNDRFVECQNLRGRNVSTNPHRVVVSQEYEPSDWVYTSDRIEHMALGNSAKNIFIDDIGDSFKAGVVLGRLASDGSIFNRDIGGSSIRQVIAEHEEDVGSILMDYMSSLGARYTKNKVRDNRNERVDWIDCYSKSLVSEIASLDVKHQIHKDIFKDTEMLRGFLRGMFDGDGGISGKTITLVFGTQGNFEPMCREIQKALLFFGIRARYHKYDYRYKITISTYDNQRFLDFIGFINEEKQAKGRALGTAVKEEKLFGRVLSVESVEITDEYIDMYDVCNTDDGYYVADGIITHNTAADIFKISVARNFMYIRENHLLGELLIINMIHDEQLFEVDAQRLNMQRILADVGRNMQFKVNGFPPLYIGAGIGPAWGKAKGKMAEIHPNLLDRLTAEAQSIPIWRDKSYEIAARGYATQDEWTPEEQAKFQHYTVAPVDVQEILKYFADRVYEFRRQKVIDYITDSSNYGKDLHPAIGNLLNLQFTYGHDKDKEGLGDNEFTQLCLSEFIKANNIPNVTANMFVAQQELTPQDDEEDEEYSDDEEGEEEDDLEIYGGTFTVIDEKNELFGSSLQDLIGIFKFFVSPDMGVCGINSMDLSYQKKDELVDFLYKHLCEYDDEGAMELIFLQPGNILNRTGLYVKGITESDMEQRVESSQPVTA